MHVICIFSHVALAKYEPMGHISYTYFKEASELLKEMVTVYSIPYLVELSDTAISVSRSILCQTFTIRLFQDIFHEP